MRMPGQGSRERERAALLINRDYALLWSGRAISITGDFVFNAGLVIWIALVFGRGQSWAPLAVSGALLASTAPVVLLGPVAGVFADRWNQRRAMLWSDGLRAVLIAVLLLAIVSGRFPSGVVLAVVFAIVVLVNTCDQFFRLSMVSLIPTIVEERRQPQALALGQGATSMAMIVGPPIAAPLVLTFGVEWALVLNMLSFLVSYGTVRAIRPPERAVPQPESTHFGRELRAGIHFVLCSRALATLVLASTIAMLGAAALNTLDVFFVTHNLHTSGSWYGFLDGAFGVGAVLGAVVAGTVTERVGLGRTVWLSLLSLGVLVLVYARLTSFAPAVVLLFICGIPLAALQISAGAVLLRVTPQALVARVSSVIDPLTILAMLIGTVLAGYLDGVVMRGFHARFIGFAFGPVDTIFTFAAVLILAGGFVAMAGFHVDEEATSVSAGAA